jgi:hypothetical protein
MNTVMTFFAVKADEYFSDIYPYHKVFEYKNNSIVSVDEVVSTYKQVILNQEVGVLSLKNINNRYVGSFYASKYLLRVDTSYIEILKSKYKKINLYTVYVNLKTGKGHFKNINSKKLSNIKENKIQIPVKKIKIKHFVL